MRQVDKAGGYDALVEWNKAADATSIKFTATNGSKNHQRNAWRELPPAYTISDV